MLKDLLGDIRKNVELEIARVRCARTFLWGSVDKFGKNGQAVERFLNEVLNIDSRAWYSFPVRGNFYEGEIEAVSQLRDAPLPASVRSAVAAAAGRAVSKISLPQGLPLGIEYFDFEHWLRTAAIAIALGDLLAVEYRHPILSRFASAGFESVRPLLEGKLSELEGIDRDADDGGLSRF